MNHLLNAINHDYKRSGSKLMIRCPVHNDSDYAMMVSQREDGSVGAHCFACGANGLDLYKHLRLPLDELQGGKERRTVVPNDIRDTHTTDKLVIAIYQAAKERGEKIRYTDEKRYRLAVARKKGIEDKWPELL